MVLEMRRMSTSNIHYVVNESLDSLKNCQEFIREIRNLPLQPNIKVALDLGKTSKYSGSFLGFLIEAIKYIRSAGSDIVLITNDEGLLELFECSGITRLVSVLPRLPMNYSRRPDAWMAELR